MEPREITAETERIAALFACGTPEQIDIDLVRMNMTRSIDVINRSLETATSLSDEWTREQKRLAPGALDDAEESLLQVSLWFLETVTCARAALAALDRHDWPAVASGLCHLNAAYRRQTERNQAGASRGSSCF